MRHQRDSFSHLAGKDGFKLLVQTVDQTKQCSIWGACSYGVEASFDVDLKAAWYVLVGDL